MGIVAGADNSTQLATRFREEIANTINRACPEAAFITARPANGQNIQWDVQTGDATPGGATQNEGADVVSFNNDVYVPAVLQFANFFEPFAITEKAIMGAAAAGNPRLLANQVRKRLMDATTRLASNFAAQIYLGAGTTNNLHGLYASGAPAIGDTGVYAGLDPVTYPAWKGNVYDALGADFDIDILRAGRKKVRDARGYDPDLYICDTTQFDKLAASFDDKRRIIENIQTVTRGDGAKFMIDGGVKMLSFEGARVIWSRNHPAQKVTMLTLSQIHFEQLPEADDSPGTLINIGGTPEQQEGAPPFQLRARIKRLAEAGDARKYSLFMYPQIVVEDRGYHGYITGLSA